jgi:hypothetical protein
MLLMEQHIISVRTNGFTVFVHKPGASGRERIPNQGCEHVPSTYRSLWKLASHHMLRRATTFQDFSLLSKALRSRCMTGGGSASPRFRLMISSPKGQSPVRYRSALGSQLQPSRKLSLEKVRLALTIAT